MEYKEGRFSTRIPVSPFRSILMVAGRPVDNAPMEQQIRDIVTEGMTCIELEWKDAYGPRVCEVRSATLGEMEQFKEALLRRTNSEDGDLGNSEIMACRIAAKLSQTIQRRLQENE